MNKWWKNTVIYQIYPKSFQDSDGDGIGDIPGIISRLDYLEKLGIGAIWLSPVFRSPQDDNGYDVSDYQDIDPMFGTLADMDRLITEAEKHGIAIILDLVLNHSSDEHRWFLEAKKSRENPYHDYYVWRDGEEGVLPNDMKASFGGQAWEWVPEVGQYYFHNFSVKQPDLNWDNPKVREELYEMIRWWMDRGVRGFRLDVIDCVAKQPDKKITSRGEMLHTYLHELTRETFSKGDLITVGETWSADVEEAKIYSDPDGSEFSMIFQFEHILEDNKRNVTPEGTDPVDLVSIKKIFERWQKGLHGCGWNSLVWDNHDLPRAVSRFGDDGKYRRESAKMLAIVLHGMQGTPYIYEGEEIGMTNIDYPLEDYRDIAAFNDYKEKIAEGKTHEEAMAWLHVRSRDNARTPMQWTDEPGAGFCPAGTEPWIRINPNHKDINVSEALEDPDSVFYCYQKLVSLRKQYDIFADGDFALLLPDDPDLFVYRRESEDGCLTVAANFSGKKREWPDGIGQDGEILVSSYPVGGSENEMRPYEAVMIWKAGGDRYQTAVG